MKEKRSSIINRVTMTPENKRGLEQLKSSLGIRTWPDFFNYLGERALADDVYIVPGLSSGRLKQEERERQDALIRHTARKEVYRILHKEGFVTEPYEK
jgi:hypothetical protein